MNSLIRIGIAFLTLSVGWGIVANFVSYFPPDFESDFLYAREEYFWGWYSTAFYIHIVTSPIALLTGLLGLSRWLLRKSPRTHRLIGRTYAYLTLLAVVPSGMVIAIKSYAGVGPTLSFLLLGVATWTCTLCGIMQAIRKNIPSHQVWMTRSFLLMFSAIVLRLNEKLFQGIDPEIAYRVNSWISWVPLIVLFEILRHGDRKTQEAQEKPQPSTILSSRSMQS